MNKRTFSFLLFLSITFGTFAQVSNSSPYSRYGLGDIQGSDLARNMGMGGIGIAVLNDSLTPVYLNMMNPASYTGLPITTFEAGMTSNTVTLKSGGTQERLNNSSPAYLAMGFPITKWWGAAFGLKPYSSIGYHVVDNEDVADVGEVNYDYQGSGGLNRFFIGNAIQPFNGSKNNLRNLSLGVHSSFLFGNLINRKDVTFPESDRPAEISSRTKTINELTMSDLNLEFGLQHSFVIDSIKGKALEEKVRISIGGVAGLQSDLKAENSILSVNYHLNPFGYELSKDTILNYVAQSGTIVLPMHYGVGFSISKGRKWIFGVDYQAQKWSEYSSFGVNGDLKDSKQYNVGAQYRPNPKSSDFFKKVQYRAGARYLESALTLKGASINEYAFSVGMGIHIGRNKTLLRHTMLNFAVEYGQRGTELNGLVEEQFVNVMMGITFNDRWFIKKKYD